jgi:hypothetical protein
MKVKLQPPFRGLCLFCPSRQGLTDEHIISRTVKKNMPAITFVTPLRGGGVVGKGATSLNLVLEDAVCQRCNTGWMSQLENRFVQVFKKQLSHPLPKRLDPSHQERVSRWAIKVALLLELFTAPFDHDTYVPMDNLRWLPDHQTPPPGSKVWIGAIRNPQKTVLWYRLGHLSVEPNQPVAYFITFSLGYFIFQVFGREIYESEDSGTVRKLPTLNPPPNLSDTLIQLWPSSGGDIVWPPRRLVERPALEALASWPDQMVTYPPGTTPPHRASPPE